jgi:hypothetical protein
MARSSSGEKVVPGGTAQKIHVHLMRFGIQIHGTILHIQVIEIG